MCRGRRGKLRCKSLTTRKTIRCFLGGCTKHRAETRRTIPIGTHGEIDASAIKANRQGGTISVITDENVLLDGNLYTDGARPRYRRQD